MATGGQLETICKLCQSFEQHGGYGHFDLGLGGLDAGLIVFAQPTMWSDSCYAAVLSMTSPAQDSTRGGDQRLLS